MGEENPAITPSAKADDELLASADRSVLAPIVPQFITTSHPDHPTKLEAAEGIFISWEPANATYAGTDRINIELRLRVFTETWTGWAEDDNGWDEFWSPDLPTMMTEHDNAGCEGSFRSRLLDEVGLWLLAGGMLERWRQNSLADEEHSQNRKRLRMVT